jgi:hypothetical protein
MALSRIQELVNGFIGVATETVAHNETAVPFGPKREMLLYTSEDTSAIKKIYTSGNALTFFAKDGELQREAINFKTALACFANAEFGRREDSRHSAWHHDEHDYESKHMHLTKTNYKVITPEEVRCLLQQIRKIENAKGLCIDDKMNCLVSREDRKQIIETYREVYSSWDEHQVKVQEIIESSLVYYCVKGAKSFAHAFLLTLLNGYIKPLLINQGLNPRRAELATQIAESLSTFALTSSLTTMAFSMLIHDVVKPILVNAGVSEDITIAMLTHVKTTLMFVDNPLSLIELGMNTKVTVLGQKAAYQVICQLPKLREEPEVVVFNEEEAAAVRELSTTLRRR